MLSKDEPRDIGPWLAAGVTAIGAGLGVALIGAVAAPELAGIGHFSVFVGMALSVAGLVAGRPKAPTPRAPELEVRSHAHR